MKFSLMRTLGVNLRQTSGHIAIGLGAARRFVGPRLTPNPLVDQDDLPALVAAAQCAPLASRRPNLHNTAANLRALVSAPSNPYSIPMRRPAISADIVTLTHNAAANEAAYTIIDPLPLSDGGLFPEPEALAPANRYAPLSPAGE